MQVEVVVRVTDDDGQTTEHAVHPEEAFLATLKWAIRDGKEPADAMAFLGDAGANYGMEMNPVGWKNRIDPLYQIR